MKRLALFLPLLALAAAPARAEDPATNAPVVWVSRIPLDGSGPRYESASGLPGRYRLGTLDDGGTYSGVARLFFGSASAWSAIHEANRARFPDPARVPAEADLAVPAPAAALPPADPGLSVSISLASVELRPAFHSAEETNSLSREEAVVRFTLSLANGTDRAIDVFFVRNTEDEAECFIGVVSFEGTNEPNCNIWWKPEVQSCRVPPRSTRTTWLEIGCVPEEMEPEMILRYECLLADAGTSPSNPDNPQALYWRGPVPVAAPRAEDPAADAAALPAWFDGIRVGMSTNEFFARVPDAKEVRNPRTDSEPGMIAYSLETGNDPFGADWFFLFKNDGLVASFAESGLKEGSLSGVRDAIVAELAVRFGEPDEKVWVPFYALIDSPDAFRISWTNETSILAVNLAEAIGRSDLTVLLAGRAFAMEDSEISTVLFGIVPDNLTADAIRHIRHFGADCVRTLIEKGEFERARSQALLLRDALIRAAEKAPDDDAEEFAEEARRLLALVTATNAPAAPAPRAESAEGAE